MLARPEPVDEAVRARALASASMCAGVRGSYAEAIAWGEEALAYYRRVGSDWGVAWVLATLAVAPMELGQPEIAGPMLEEAEALHRKLGAPRVSGALSTSAGSRLRLSATSTGARGCCASPPSCPRASETASARRARSTRWATSSSRQELSMRPKLPMWMRFERRGSRARTVSSATGSPVSRPSRALA